MSDPDAIRDQIEADAQKAKATDVDGTKITRRSIKDQIDGENHVRAAEGAANTTHRGLYFSKLKPPSTTG